MMKETFSVLTIDFESIGATWYRAEKPGGTTVIINAATGVKQQYYADYAGFLATQGFQVYTYDYRGIGHSRNKSLRKQNASIMDWAEKDFSAMIDHAKASHPSNSIVIVGHSIGGQILGMNKKSQQADALVMVASQTPFWKNFSPKWKIWLFWHVMIPFFTKLFGFFPAKTLGLFENLPQRAALQWALWAKSPDYLFGEFPEKLARFQSLSKPALVFSFTDDRLAPLDAVNDLLQYYKGLQVDHRHLHPEVLASDAIGHFGFFRKRFENTLWQESVDWIRRTVKKKERSAA